jgi:hypothetical protein
MSSHSFLQIREGRKLDRTNIPDVIIFKPLYFIVACSLSLTFGHTGAGSLDTVP